MTTTCWLQLQVHQITVFISWNCRWHFGSNFSGSSCSCQNTNNHSAN